MTEISGFEISFVLRLKAQPMRETVDKTIKI